MKLRLFHAALAMDPNDKTIDRPLADHVTAGGSPGESLPQAGAEQLTEQAYALLRAMAQERMRGERAGHTLQPTVLVHEAWVRMQGSATPPRDRRQFLHAAAQAMRRILIEHARGRGRQKRGGGRARIPLDVVDVAQSGDPQEILALDEAIRRLEAEEPDLAELVRLRFFAGLSVDETAQVLGLSARTVDQRWTYARAWLYRAMVGRA